MFYFNFKNKERHLEISLFYICVAKILVFYIICSLTYFHIKLFVHVQQKTIYLHSLWTQIILAVKSIRWLYHNVVANLFVQERQKIPEAHSEPSQTSKMELFPKTINGSTFFEKTLTYLTGFWIRLCLLLRNFLHTFRERNFTGKKLEN